MMKLNYASSFVFLGVVFFLLFLFPQNNESNWNFLKAYLYLPIFHQVLYSTNFTQLCLTASDDFFVYVVRTSEFLNSEFNFLLSFCFWFLAADVWNFAYKMVIVSYNSF